MISKLKKGLGDGVVKFTYIKIDGTTRTAMGTCEHQLLQEEGGIPKGTGKKKSEVITYWDLEKGAWRSCREGSVIRVDEVYDFKRYF